LRKIIHAYFLTDQRSKGEPVSLADVAKAMSTDPTWVSRNNKFLAAIGIITGGRKKTVTQAGRELGLALDHDQDSQIRQVLAVIVDDSDFLSRVTDAVRVRGGMDSPSLQTHIAITAGAAKTKPAMAGAAAIIQILLLAGRLVDDGGTLRVGDSRSAAAEDVEPDETSDTTSRPPATGSFVHGGSRAIPSGQSERLWTIPSSRFNAPTLLIPPGTTPVNINININLTADNVDAVIELLQKLTAERDGAEE
jgi:hypothetical protein